MLLRNVRQRFSGVQALGGNLGLEGPGEARRARPAGNAVLVNMATSSVKGGSLSPVGYVAFKM